MSAAAGALILLKLRLGSGCRLPGSSLNCPHVLHALDFRTEFRVAPASLGPSATPSAEPPAPSPSPPSLHQAGLLRCPNKGREEGSSPCGQPGGPKLCISFKPSVSLNVDANFNPLHNQYVVEYINAYDYLLTHLKLEPGKTLRRPVPGTTLAQPAFAGRNRAWSGSRNLSLWGPPTRPASPSARQTAGARGPAAKVAQGCVLSAGRGPGSPTGRPSSFSFMSSFPDSFWLGTSAGTDSLPAVSCLEKLVATLLSKPLSSYVKLLL